MNGFRHKFVVSKNGQAKLRRYQDGLIALLFRPELLKAQAEKERIADQIASDGGYEVAHD